MAITTHAGKEFGECAAWPEDLDPGWVVLQTRHASSLLQSESSSSFQAIIPSLLRL